MVFGVLLVARLEKTFKYHVSWVSSCMHKPFFWCGVHFFISIWREVNFQFFFRFSLTVLVMVDKLAVYSDMP